MRPSPIEAGSSQRDDRLDDALYPADRWMRRQHGVCDRPTRIAISATASDASVCMMSMILRSMRSSFSSGEFRTFLPIDQQLFDGRKIFAVSSAADVSG